MIRIAHIPSSLKGFRACQRRWRYTQDAPPDDKPEFRLGTEMHRQREAYLKDGEPLIGMAAAGIEHLPGPACADGVNLLVEHRWEMPVGPVLLFGTADLLDLRDRHLPVLSDHKTTKNLDFFGLKPEQLAVDPQLNCYARWVLEEKAPHARMIVLQHLYIETVAQPDGTYRGACREVVVTRDSVETQWGAIVKSIEQMAVYRCLPPEEVPANSAACSEYGGCRFLGVCSAANL